MFRHVSPPIRPNPMHLLPVPLGPLGPIARSRPPEDLEILPRKQRRKQRKRQPK